VLGRLTLNRRGNILDMKPVKPLLFSQKISTEDQSVFEECINAQSIPTSFEDSTHQLWLCQFGSNTRFLKLCSKTACDHSIFWRAMNWLFEFNIASSLANYQDVYKQVADWSSLRIPDLIYASSCDVLEGSEASSPDGFLLTDYLKGQALTSGDLTQDQVLQVAEHLALLHQHSRSTFGPLFKGDQESKNKAIDWQQNLKKTFSKLNERNSLNSQVLIQTTRLIDDLTVTEFQPIMLDLRWDQFMQLEGGGLALVDLDAMVWGPKALEWVMLEYLLDEKQAELFKSVYCQHHTIPDLSLERAIYRVLLFQMNVLGETDFERWMAHPVRF